MNTASPPPPPSATGQPSVSPTADATSSSPPVPAGVEPHVPAVIAATCRVYSVPSEAGIDAGLLAAVRCLPTGAGAPAQAYYLLYDGRSTLAAAFRSLTGEDFVAGGCTRAGQEAAYRTSESRRRVGILRCYWPGSTRVLAWTHDRLRILAVAEDETLSFARLAAWWRTAGPYVDPGSRPTSTLE